MTLLPSRTGIYSVLNNKEFTKADIARKLEIMNTYMILMEKSFNLLMLFEVTTSQLTGKLHPTLGSVYPFLWYS